MVKNFLLQCLYWGPVSTTMFVYFYCSFYVIGGSTHRGTKLFIMSLPTFNFESQHWSDTDTLPCPRTGEYPVGRVAFGFVQHGNDVTIAGGRSDVQVDLHEPGDADYSFVINDVWVLNIQTLQWHQHVFDLPRTLFFHTITLHTDTGRLYVFGGVHNNVRQNTLYVSQFYWLSLAERCWEQVSAMLVSGLRKNDCGEPKFSDKQLCDLGIPLKFVNRLSSDILSRPIL